LGIQTADRLKSLVNEINNPLAEESRNIFTRVYETSALAAAKASDARKAADCSLSSVDGLIVSIKDLFDVKGEVTLAGGLENPEDKPALADATVVSDLRAKGAVIIGKTNMTEFAFSGLGLNPHYGNPTNALDPQRIPGGSSSGSAISVALDLADIAIGSDTGGSVRIPAALNGLVGFKPSQSRISRHGVFPLSYTLDCVGFIAKDLSLIKRAYNALAIDDQTHEAGVDTVRCGVPRGFLFSDMEPIVAGAFETLLLGLEAKGHRISDVDLDTILTMPFQLQAKGTIVGAEAAYIHADRMDDPSRFDPFVLSRLRKGQALDAATYVGILRQRDALMLRLDAAMADLDILILPTVPIVAPRFSDLQAGGALDRTNALLLRNPSVFNFFDLPAMSLPIVSGNDTLAVGCMIVGKRGNDRALLSIAEAFQAAVHQPAR
jgi:aspartyl-tRNA(Asn)/glutamyl-tRNA(Gln) amidotransferase subunit A